jgi:dynein heavy chain
VRGELTAMQRLTLGALVVIDVHARDSISHLVHSGVERADNFEWQSQVGRGRERWAG